MDHRCVACGSAEAKWREKSRPTRTFCNAICQVSDAIGVGLEDLPCDVLLLIVQRLDPTDFRAMRTMSKRLRNCIDTGSTSEGAPAKMQALNLLAAMQANEENQLAAIRVDANVIKDMENPSIRVQLASVRVTGFSIQYIKNPSEMVQLEAVRTFAWAIQVIENPSEAVQLAAIRENVHAIIAIENPTEAVQLAVVRQVGYFIHRFKHPSEAVQLAAVQQDAHVIVNLKNPAPAVLAYMAARKRHRVNAQLMRGQK